MSGTIDKDVVEQKLEEADAELDSAVEHGANEQAKYWLGRKEALKDLLETNCDHLGPTIDEYDGSMNYEKCAKCGAVLNKYPL